MQISLGLENDVMKTVGVQKGVGTQEEHPGGTKNSTIERNPDYQGREQGEGTNLASISSWAACISWGLRWGLRPSAGPGLHGQEAALPARVILGPALLGYLPLTLPACLPTIVHYFSSPFISQCSLKCVILAC